MGGNDDAAHLAYLWEELAARDCVVPDVDPKRLSPRLVATMIRGAEYRLWVLEDEFAAPPADWPPPMERSLADLISLVGSLFVRELAEL